MNKVLLKYYYFSLALLAFSIPVNAVEVVRSTIVTTISSTTTTHIVDISLLDNDAPDTVSNFLSNIDSNLYDNLFFNRNIEGFVIQAGGYTFNPPGDFSYAGNDLFEGGLQPTPNVTIVVNEFKLSNLRGTLAMAKASGDADSNSNEWFINIADNTVLDTVDGGFTVFGEILGNGMEAIDQITTTPAFDLSADIDFKNAFLDVPLNNHTNGIGDDNLIKITLSHFFHITDIVDFGEADPLLIVSKSIVTSNNSDADLTIDFDQGTISPPFTVINDGCSSTPLPAAAICTIDIEFAPDTTDYFEAQLV